ncbi:beta-1 [Tropilaelaps mercedesae]|uniref:Hexosyltransferase n=1 Tax=Tropilaelaps mercedesae TaxID=418985 RepID=A0A1V9X2I0_9ACAR|nr:beta-1 [Tropilaelaps mercedesae]
MNVDYVIYCSYLLYGIPRHPNRIHCLVWRRVRVARRFTSKWFVSKREYALPYYPPYCGGLAYIIPRSLLLPLIDASYNVPFFWIDDVYATGLLARQAHVGHTQISAYYAFQVNESAALTPDWEGTMINAFGTTDIMFAHMNTKGLRSLRDFLFQVIDETLLNYTAFNIF